jgi:alkylhydroperoxidase family enzyme
MDTLLSPIDKPSSFGLWLAFYFTKKKFGKVLMPMRVHSNRLPTAFGLFYNKLSVLDKKLELSQEMALLIRQKVAQINICEFCIDASRSYSIERSYNQNKFDDLAKYQSSPLFSEGEKVALDYTTELTRDKKINPETFDRLKKYFSEREICEIIYLISSEHLYNLTNIGLNIHSDMLCDVVQKNKK